MRKLELTFPEVLFLGLTHLVLGAGLGFLLAGSVGTRSRKRIGGALTAVGVATGGPRIALLLRGKRRAAAPWAWGAELKKKVFKAS
jgi:hypothetical protein